jgi:hypothetical protein
MKMLARLAFAAALTAIAILSTPSNAAAIDWCASCDATGECYVCCRCDGSGTGYGGGPGFCLNYCEGW